MACGSGRIPITNMIRAGICFDILGSLVIWIGLGVLLPLVGPDQERGSNSRIFSSQKSRSAQRTSIINEMMRRLYDKPLEDTPRDA
jgi:hypothetical protein